MITLTSVEAQDKFGELLDTVQREPVTITRHGRPIAFIVSPQDMDELLDARRKRSEALADFEAWSARAAQRVTPDAAELTDEDVDRLVRAIAAFRGAGKGGTVGQLLADRRADAK
jgi:prevent-host-death family protein